MNFLNAKPQNQFMNEALQYTFVHVNLLVKKRANIFFKYFNAVFDCLLLQENYIRILKTLTNYASLFNIKHTLPISQKFFVISHSSRDTLLDDIDKRF